jgi:hypothetical protein
MKHGNFRFRFWWLLSLAFVALFSLLVMALWNWLLPAIAGLPAITFWQALGLLALSRILFGGFGGMGRLVAGGAMRGRDRGQLGEKWFKMSDEERREFISKHHPHHHPFNPRSFDRCGAREPEPDKEPDKDKE